MTVLARATIFIHLFTQQALINDAYELHSEERLGYPVQECLSNLKDNEKS